MEVGLADDHCAGGGESARHFGILSRHPVVEHRAGGSRPDAGRVDVVLERNRNAVQRAAQPAGPLFGVERARLREGGLARHRDEGVDFRVVNLDALQAGVHEVGRRDRPRLDAGRCLAQSQAGERVSRSRRVPGLRGGRL